MSIIYDALKKVEKANLNILKSEAVKEPRQPKFKVYFLYIASICIGLFIAHMFFGFLTPAKEPAPKPLVSLEKPEIPLPSVPDAHPARLPSPPPDVASDETKEPQGPLVLNGIFYSENEAYALINNKIVQDNDVVAGAVVKKINPEDVELEVGGKTVRLSSSTR